MSKADNLPMEIYSTALAQCISVEILDITQHASYAEIQKIISTDFYDKLLQNKLINTVLGNTMKKVINQSKFELDIKLVFIKSSITGLSGFSGSDRVYVNVNRLANMHFHIIKKVSKEV